MATEKEEVPEEMTDEGTDETKVALETTDNLGTRDFVETGVSPQSIEASIETLKMIGESRENPEDKSEKEETGDKIEEEMDEDQTDINLKKETGNLTETTEIQETTGTMIEEQQTPEIEEVIGDVTTVRKRDNTDTPRMKQLRMTDSLEVRGEQEADQGLPMLPNTAITKTT